VGDEYKTARKILLRNLSGNSAFKNGAPAKMTEVSSSELYLIVASFRILKK